jgi:O-antigen/teichoic acid export membrane protein
VAAVPVFSGLALVMPDLVGTIFNSKWAPAIIVAQIAALGWVITFPRILVAPILRARGRQGGLVAYAIVACLGTVVAGLLTGGHGLLVVALVWTSHHVIAVPWNIYAINRYLGISPKRLIATVARPLVAAALMAGAVLAVGALAQDLAASKRLVALVATGAASYFIVMAMIDRATLRLARTILVDIWQARRAA